MPLRWPRNKIDGWGLALGMVLLLAGCGPTDAERVQEARRLYSQWRLVEAEERLRPLAARSTPLPDSIALLHAEVLFQRRALPEARALLARLAQSGASYRPTALRHLAHTHFFLGHPDTSGALARVLLTEARQQHDTLRMAQAHHILGLVGFYHATYDSARIHQQRSLHLARRIHDRQTQADALRQLGVLAWYRGLLDSARTAYYEPALQHYRAIGDRSGEATTLSNLGLLDRDPEMRLRYQLRAFDIRKRIGDQVGLVDSYQFLAGNYYMGNVDSRLVHATQTYSYLKKSLDISKKIGYAWGYEVGRRALESSQTYRLQYVQGEAFGQWRDSLQTVSGEGRVYAEHHAALRAYYAGRWEEALARLQHLYDQSDTLGVPDLALHTRVWQIKPLRQLQRWDTLEAVLQEIDALRSGDYRARAGLAERYIASQRPAQAEALLKPLVVRYDSLYLQKLFETAPEVAFERATGAVHMRRTDLYLILLRALVAQQKYAEAFAYLERERSLPFWGDPSAGGGPQRQQVSRFVRLLAQFDAAPPGDEDVQTLLAAVGAMQQAMLAEQRAVAQAAPPVDVLETTSLTTLQQTLAPDEVFLTYALDRAEGTLYPVLEERFAHVMAVRQDTVALLTLDDSAEVLTSVVDVYRRMLLRGKDHPADTLWLAPARRLYRTLLGPLMEGRVIHPGDRLLISAHGPLHQIPFHALPASDGHGGPRFVLTQHIVSYVSSATALVRSRSQRPGPPRSLLAVAPDSRSLPYARQEVEAIPANLFIHRKTLHDGTARADEVLRNLEQYDVIHLAAHAEINERFPLYSHIALRDRPLELHEILRTKLHARLVVLSACETGRSAGVFGHGLSGADRVSFPRALLSAGSAAVIASLWLVEDVATADLMRGFYQNLSETCGAEVPFQPVAGPSGCGFAEALIAAQRQALASAYAMPHGKRHPFYWAGFYLTGDGR